MKAMIFGCVSVIFVVMMTGCAGKAESMNMVYEGQHQFDKSLQKEVQVKEVVGGEKTNPLWKSEIEDAEFKTALKASLKAQDLLAEEGTTGRYQLKATLVEVEQPLFGFNCEVVTHVRYDLIDTTSNETLMSEVIQASHTATVSDAFAGIKRLRLANEGSAKKNIGAFLEALSALDIPSQNVSLQ